MWRRTRLVTVPDELSLPGLIERLGEIDVVVIDVDNTLVPDSAPDSAIAAGLDAVRDAVDRSGVGRLVVASNGSPSRSTAGQDIVWGMGKPMTRRSTLGIDPEDSVAVVGDKILADGLLAHRWGADFYLKPITPRRDDTRTGFRAAVSRLAERCLFTVETLDPTA